MGLTDIVVDIQTRETGKPIASDLIARLRDLADEYGMDENPAWLLPIFDAVQRDRVISPAVFFERSGSDPHSYLYELIQLFHWKGKQPGEYILIEFPKLGLRVYISHEAYDASSKRSGSSYEIARL